MSDFFNFSKELEKKKFIEFLVENNVHPSDLITLAIKIKNNQIFQEESEDTLGRIRSGGSKSGFLSALGGALRGMYHGFKAGLGSRSLNNSANTLKKQLELAYEKFLDSLIGMTRDERQAVNIVTQLRRNANQDIDEKIFGIEPVAPLSRPSRPLAPIEDDEEEEAERPTPEEPPAETGEEEGPEDGPEESPEEGAEGEPEETSGEEGPEDGPEEGAEGEPEETSGEEEDTPPTDDGMEGREPPAETEEEEDRTEEIYQIEFDNRIKAGNTTEILNIIINEYPVRNKNSINALIAIMNANEINESYLQTCHGILINVYQNFVTQSKQRLARSFMDYVKTRLSENVKNKVFPETPVTTGEKLVKTIEEKIDIIKNGDTKNRKYIFDMNKIERDDDLSGLFNDPLRIFTRIDKAKHKLKSKKESIPEDDAFVKIILDSNENYITLDKKDMQKIVRVVASM